MNYLLQVVVKIWSVEFEGDFVCIKRHACTKLILRACSFNSSGILMEIVTHMNMLRVRVHYPYLYTDIGYLILIWSRWHDRWGPPPPCKQALKQLTFKLISILFSPSVNSILQCKTTYLLQKEPLVGSQNRRSLNHECQKTNINNIAMHTVYMYGVDWLKTVLSFLSSKCSLFYNTHSGRALSTLSG